MCWITISCSVILIAYQFASYLGWDQVVEYWTSRYQDRGLSVSHRSKFVFSLKILRNLGTGFLPAIFCLVVGFLVVKKRFLGERFPLPLKWAVLLTLSACILDNIVFLNWAGEHDFSVLPYSIGISLMSMWLIIHLPGPKQLT